MIKNTLQVESQHLREGGGERSCPALPCPTKSPPALRASAPRRGQTVPLLSPELSLVSSSVFPSPDQPASLPLLPAALNTGGSLPDLTNLHFPSPLPTPVDPDESAYPTLSGGSSTGNLANTMTHLGISGSLGMVSGYNSPGELSHLSSLWPWPRRGQPVGEPDCPEPVRHVLVSAGSGEVLLERPGARGMGCSQSGGVSGKGGWELWALSPCLWVRRVLLISLPSEEAVPFHAHVPVSIQMHSRRGVRVSVGDGGTGTDAVCSTGVKLWRLFIFFCFLLSHRTVLTYAELPQSPLHPGLP